jgi:iron complex outermembrane receptor protein
VAQEGEAGPAADRGASALKKLTLEELSQLEVSVTSKELSPAFRMPAAIYVLTAEDIRRSGATSIPEVLRLMPGVQTAQMDSGKWAIGVRGFQGRLSRAVLVLIDGRSVYTPLFAGVYWEQQHVMLEDVERIELVRGPGATIWGANAVNGVINIITKSAKETRGMLATASGGNVNQGRLGWRYGWGTDKLSARVYGQGLTRGPQLHTDNRNFDDWRMGQVGFRLDWAKSDRDTFTLQGDAYGTVSGQKLVVSEFNPAIAPAIEDNGFYNGQNLIGVWKRKFAAGSDIQVSAYFDRTNRTDLNYHEIRNTFDFDFLHHIPRGRHAVTWGAGARTSPSEFIQTRATVNFLPHKETYNIFSGFLQDEINVLPDRFSLTVGSKFEHNSYSGFEYQPTARVSYTPNSRNTIWGAVSRAVRTPSRVEEDFRYSALIVPATSLYVRLIGDGQFTPEQLIGYEFGYRTYMKKTGFISIAAFHNRYDDLLSVESLPTTPETNPPPARLVLPLNLRNGVKAVTSGVELATLWDIRKWWRVRGSYSFVGIDARNKRISNDASTVRQLEGDSPAHKAIVQSEFNLPKGFEIDLTWRAVSRILNQQVPGYSTGYARIGRRITSGLDLSLVGQDLLQPSHVEYGGNPGPQVRIRRSAYLKLTWTR